MQFSNVDDDSNVKKDEGEFTFLNGDAYTGGFMIVKTKKFITRQGYGVYTTEDFNKYKAFWVEDQIVNQVHICHNNRTEYEGTLGSDGRMSGYGIYTFADNSILHANWDKNKPVADILLIGPEKSIWKGVYNTTEINFTAANHFWDELSSTINEESESEGKFDLDDSSNDLISAQSMLENK